MIPPIKRLWNWIRLPEQPAETLGETKAILRKALEVSRGVNDTPAEPFDSAILRAIRALHPNEDALVRFSLVKRTLQTQKQVSEIAEDERLVAERFLEQGDTWYTRRSDEIK